MYFCCQDISVITSICHQNTQHITLAFITDFHLFSGIVDNKQILHLHMVFLLFMIDQLLSVVKHSTTTSIIALMFHVPLFMMSQMFGCFTDIITFITWKC